MTNCQKYLDQRDSLFAECRNSLLALDTKSLSDAINRLLEVKSKCRFREPDDDPLRLQRPDRAAIFDFIIRNYFCELDAKHDKLADELFKDYQKINDPENNSSLVSHNEMIHFLNSGIHVQR